MLDKELLIFKRVRTLLSQYVHDASIPIVMNSYYVDDLGLDSLDYIEFIMDVEENFFMEIPDEVIETFRTVGDAVHYIASH